MASEQLKHTGIDETDLNFDKATFQ